jgi:citrate synthase
MSGPLHGGAPSRVLPMLEEVERTGDADGYVKGILDRKEKLMGFGHRVYRAEDPRARVLRRTAEELGAPRYEVAVALEQAALKELRERRPDHPIETNVEFWAACPGLRRGAAAHDARDVHLGPHRRVERAHHGAEARVQAGAPVGPVHRARPRRPEDVEGWDEIAHT